MVSFTPNTSFETKAKEGSSPVFLSRASNSQFNGALRNLLENENMLNSDARSKFLEELEKGAHSSRNIRDIFANCMGKANGLHKKLPKPPLQNPDQHIPFCQTPLIGRLNSADHKTLKRIEQKYEGLCEIICNFVLTNDLLGKAQDDDYLVNQIQLDALNQKGIKKSHILNVYGIFRKAMAFLFGIYPDNLFSFIGQLRLVKTTKVTKQEWVHTELVPVQAMVTRTQRHVNKKLLHKKLSSVAANETIKLETIKKSWFSFGGHATLIKKISDDNYIFFDPNDGETRKLTFDNLCDKIDDQLDKWGNDLFFTKGEDYKKRMPKS